MAYRPSGDASPVRIRARTVISEEGASSLRAEIARLRQQLEFEFPRRLREAGPYGHDNDDYLQVKEEEAVVASRLQQLEALLASSSVQDRSEDAATRATIGSTVEVEDLASGRRSEHVLTGGHFEQFANNDISVNSPIGRALLGHVPGDEVTAELPSGRQVRLRITELRRSD